ncbi:TonB-dependent receptor plug domain-containing protein [Flammeovirga kamogawensis]|uniref:TonB-dependent receptor n=1 Tax=Flammeovirga kamogawensis TaxID=373891 RepID=A0ABX8GW67_9BACT|nr:TonB-dependent receptor [Flammeovirga kamogawensis]MBB6461286.1 iron complex outermembrane receptor protein [Flammeovirga kamogawensis]QWG07845.1 TonB-dependent receptor [Flammeovirga kamogawensis]TRX69650.1 TonB-dependent receptor [Flammeovirga kamogawensis]
MKNNLLRKRHFFTIVLFLLTYSIFGQTKIETDTSKITEYYLEEISVNSGRVPQLYSEQARIVTYIDSEKLQEMPVQSLDQVLGYVAGVDMRSRGPLGVQGDLNIRGGSFDQSLVMLNGVNMNNPQTGHLNLFLPVDMEAAYGVEVLEGPASRVFGANAFTGAVNVQTKPLDQNNIYAHAMYGDYNLQKYTGRVNLASEKTRHLITTSYKKSDGYTDNTDFEDVTAYYHGSYDVKGGTFDLTAGYSDKGFGANSFYTPAYPNQYERNQLYHGSLRFTNNGKIKITPMIYWNRTYDRFELFRENPASWYQNHNYHRMDAAGANVNAVIPSKFGKTAIGLDARYEGIISNVLGTPLDNPVAIEGVENTAYTNGKERYNYSLFLEHNVILGKFTASVGLMFNYNTQLEENGKGFDIFPGADVSYALSNSWRLFTTVNTAMRIPTYTDLYYDGPTNVGNDSLKEERAVTLELGAKYDKNGISGSASVFRRWGTDIIDWVKEHPDSLWQAQNLTELTTTGVTLNAGFDLTQMLHKEVFLKNIRFSYLYLTADKGSSEYISNYVLDYLKHKATLGISHGLFLKNLKADWQVVYQDRNGSFTAYDPNGNGQEVSYDPFTTVDLRISYTWKNLYFYGEGSNIFDVQYYDIGNIQQPGRWLRAGIKMNLDF